MEPDDLPLRADDLLKRLVVQDLGPFSVAELEARVAALDGEIARVRRRIDHAVSHRADADSLFRR